MTPSMDVRAVISEIERLGGQLYLAGEKVKYRPVGDPQIEPIIEKLRPYREDVRRLLRERQLAPCGSVTCGGCYEVWPGGPRIHPPRCSVEWLRWRERWEKVKQ